MDPQWLCKAGGALQRPGPGPSNAHMGTSNPQCPRSIHSSPNIGALGVRLGLAMVLWPGTCRGTAHSVPAHEGGHSHVTPTAGPQRGGTKCCERWEMSRGGWHYDPTSPAYPQAKINQNELRAQPCACVEIYCTRFKPLPLAGTAPARVFRPLPSSGEGAAAVYRLLG